jgi:hypothetical protein
MTTPVLHEPSAPALTVDGARRDATRARDR